MTEPTNAAVAASAKPADPVTAGLNLAEAIVGLIGDERSQRFLTTVRDKKLELHKERMKPLEKQDHVKLKTLELELAVHIEAAQDFVKLLEVRKS